MLHCGSCYRPKPADPPRLLRVLSEDEQHHTEGVYMLVDRRANGQPVWKNVSAEFYLYRMKHGYWGISARAQTQNFASNDGFIASRDKRNDALPHLTPVWQTYDDDGHRFVDDLRIKVQLEEAGGS